MALTHAQKKKIEEEEMYKAQLQSAMAGAIKGSQKHGMPALLSFFIPGLGQMVKGQVGRGILIFIVFWIGVAMLVIPGVIVWIWQIMDAYNN